MIILIYPVNFSSIPCIYFSKWRMAKFPTPPVPLNFDGLPYPMFGVFPNSFHQNDRKDIKQIT